MRPTSAAVLEREVAARNASGAQLLIRAATMSALQNDRRLRLRTSTHRPHTNPSPDLGRLPHRTPQRRTPRATGHRENTPGQRTGHRRLPPRPPRPIRHRHRMGRPTHRSPRPRTPTSRTGQTPPLPTHHRRRSRLPALRARSSEPVLPTRLITLRTRLPHTHQQPAIPPGAACSATKSSPQQ